MEVRATDSFDIRPGMPGIKHVPGVILVFEAAGIRPLPKPGDKVQITPPDAGAKRVVIGEVKKHGTGRSIFIEGLTRFDAPIGTIITWSSKSSSPRKIKPRRIVATRRR
jgi:hypothetical protein